MKYFFPVLITALLSLNVQAENTGKVLDIKFPDAETDVVFQLSKSNPQITLLSFWRVDCVPCLKDMAVNSLFSKQHPDVRMLGISISDKKSTRQVWQQQKMPFPTLVNDGFPGELLQRFGNSLAAVPYTVILNTDRVLCWSVMGEVTEELLQQGLQSCK